MGKGNQVTDLITCHGRKRRVHPDACKVCHLSTVCKMDRDDDKTKKSKPGPRQKYRMDVSVTEIMKLRNEGLFMREIAERLNVNRWTIAERIREANGGR